MTDIEKTQKALADPTTKMVAIEMTEERKARYSKICDDLIDWLTARTESPGEAILILHFVKHSLEESYEVHSVQTIQKGELGSS